MTDRDANTPAPRRALPAVMTEIVFPQDTNAFGTMFGGAGYAMMDKAAFLAANRFSGMLAVTAASERVEFTTPIRHGMIIDVVAQVIHAGRTSMIVEVELYCQEPLDGERKLATSGYFTMVAVDVNGHPIEVPELLLETDDDRRRWQIGEEIRLAARARRSRS